MRKYTYFKRYRMEADLRRPPLALADPSGARIRPAILPAGFQWLPWRDSLVATHAEVKALCFQDETDAIIFRCLASLGGCRDLMAAIRARPGFCPQATWLVVAAPCGGKFPTCQLPMSKLETCSHKDASTGLAGNCIATVQGAIDSNDHGGIQNVGVMPEFRGRGLGLALMLKALEGFVQCGAKRAYLEVTARNLPAMRMYRSLGFRCTQTVYRAVEVPEPVAVGL